MGFLEVASQFLSIPVLSDFADITIQQMVNGSVGTIKLRMHVGGCKRSVSGSRALAESNSSFLSA